MLEMTCSKCNKKWYRYFDNIITEEDYPYACPHCEQDKMLQWELEHNLPELTILFKGVDY
jgi:DNA-directed RNA polymerase subunit RPC12/RpoP